MKGASLTSSPPTVPSSYKDPWPLGVSLGNNPGDACKNDENKPVQHK
jgi:hypothetical protein